MADNASGAETMRALITSKPEVQEAEPDCLSALPAELLVNIFARVPVKETYRNLRMASKPIKAVIDANETTISYPTVAVHQDRLKTSVDNFVNTSNVPFSEVIKRYLLHYTTPQAYDTQHDILARLCRAHVKAKYGNVDSQTCDQLLRELLGFAVELLSGPEQASLNDWWHDRVRLPTPSMLTRSEEAGDLINVMFYQGTFHHFATLTGDGTLFETVPSTCAVVKTLKPTPPQFPYMVQPRPLPRWTGYPMYWASKDGKRNGFEDGEGFPGPNHLQFTWLAAWLGIPFLRRTADFGYVVTRRHVLDHMVKICKKHDGYAMEDVTFEKAWMLENMCVW